MSICYTGCTNAVQLVMDKGRVLMPGLVFPQPQDEAALPSHFFVWNHQETRFWLIQHQDLTSS